MGSEDVIEQIKPHIVAILSVLVPALLGWIVKLMSQRNKIEEKKLELQQSISNKSDLKATMETEAKSGEVSNGRNFKRPD